MYSIFLYNPKKQLAVEFPRLSSVQYMRFKVTGGDW